MTTLIKRLTLDVTADEHRRLKTLASFYGVTMKDFLLASVIDGGESGQKFRKKTAPGDETSYLLQSAPNKKRLLESLKRRAKGRKTFGSVKELKHALGI